MFNVVEHCLGNVARSSCALTVSKAGMCSLAQTKAVVAGIFKSLLYTTGFTFPVLKNIGKIVDRALDEEHIRDVEEAWTTVADDKPVIWRLAALHNTAIQNIIQLMVPQRKLS